LGKPSRKSEASKKAERVEAKAPAELGVAKERAATAGREEEVRVAPIESAAMEPSPPKPTKLPANEPALVTVGNFDHCSGRMLTGWAALQKGKEYLQASLELLIDGIASTTVTSKILRSDLKDSGIGSGEHGFELEVPASCCDGNEHQFALRVRETGEILPNSSTKLRFDKPSLLQRMELEGMVFVCAGSFKDDYYLISVSLAEGDKPIAHSYEIARDGRNFEVRIPLPTELCDGCVHTFTARIGDDGPLLGELAAITPFFLTPIQVVLDHGGGPVKSSFRTAGFRRYDALHENLKLWSGALDRSRAEAATGDDMEYAEKIRNAVVAHDALVRGFETKRHKHEPYAPLKFWPLEAPRVSVVIPVHNKFAVTYHGLAALILAPNRASFEVIIVDDASSDETTEIERVVSGITVVRNDKGLGFVRGCNRGAAAVRGEYVVMLNNDTEVAPYWIDELLWAFEHFQNVGMTGAKLIYPNGRLQEAGGIVWGNGDPWNFGRNGNARDPRYNYSRQIDYISGACIMLPKVLWDELGGFDEHFAPAYYEDADLAFRVRQKGYKTVYTPFAEVVHFEGMSNGTDVASGTKRFQEVNRPKFLSRWALSYRNNGEVGKNVDLVKDRNVAYRALVIDYGSPRPDQDAGGYAAVQEMRLLQSLGFKLTFVAENVAYLGKYTDSLQRMGIECVYAPFAYSVNEVIETRGGEFDMVFITRYGVAAKYIDLIRQRAPKAKIVFNNADLHFLRELRQGIALRNKDIIHQSIATRDAELGVMRKVDVVLSYNEVEHAVIMSHNLDSTKVAKCPWVVEVAKEVPGFEKRKDLAFLGGFGHPPNLEAVKFFVADVMPLLRKALPGVRFVVYGSNLPKEIEEMEDEDVVAGGWVEDVAEVFDTCRLFVVPLKSGAGIKGKVLGALAHGVPSVVSPVAMEGVGAAEGVDLLVADKPQQWVEAIASLYNDQEKWEAMSRAAQDLARRRYSFAAGRELMKAALDQAQVFTSDEYITLWA